MLSEEQFNKYSKLLDNILHFKPRPSADKGDLEKPKGNLGPVTDATKLLKFLKISTTNSDLKEKCDEVYKIINSTKESASDAE